MARIPTEWAAQWRYLQSENIEAETSSSAWPRFQPRWRPRALTSLQLLVPVEAVGHSMRMTKVVTRIPPVPSPVTRRQVKAQARE